MSSSEVNVEIEAKYGLPSEVKFCQTCVISNQRPNSTVEYGHSKDSKKETIHFDGEGICDACRIAARKKEIDWHQREKMLMDLCDRFRRNDGSYDCIVPGSGGKDSFYTSHLLKYKYGMNPLTVTWAPHMYTEWGWRNFQAWIHSGFDNQLFTPNPRVHRLLTRLSVERLFHPFQPFFFGQKTIAPKISRELNVPLIFYGESNAEYGDPKKHNENPLQNNAYYIGQDQSKMYLGGASLAELMEQYGLSRHDLRPYMPLDPGSAEGNQIEVHHLSYYVKWHPQSCYYYSVEHGGFEVSPERTPGTYSKYSSIDDKIDDFHFYTTFIKFGIGRATYDASQEIRSGDITREEGVALTKRFDGEFPTRFEQDFYNYISLPKKQFPIASRLFEKPIVDREYFMSLCDKFRSPHLWEKSMNQWKLKRVVWD